MPLSELGHLGRVLSLLLLPSVKLTPSIHPSILVEKFPNCHWARGGVLDRSPVCHRGLVSATVYFTYCMHRRQMLISTCKYVQYKTTSTFIFRMCNIYHVHYLSLLEFATSEDLTPTRKASMDTFCKVRVITINL